VPGKNFIFYTAVVLLKNLMRYLITKILLSVLFLYSVYFREN